MFPFELPQGSEVPMATELDRTPRDVARGAAQPADADLHLHRIQLRPAAVPAAQPRCRHGCARKASTSRRSRSSRWCSFPYTWKFLWSPLLDRYALPWLGRRRGWMFAMHVALIASIAALGFLAPQDRDLDDRVSRGGRRVLLREPRHRDGRVPPRDPAGRRARASAIRSTSTRTGSRASFPVRWR